ncbi:hypothetical protein C8Q80DRAFT_458365 [Daedaleopsis nitida]|nr:hypothetical protein C8Q80DRAFT_458365 [Daedaleopsis nitida]
MATDGIDLSHMNFSIPWTRVEELSSALSNASMALQGLGSDSISQRLRVQMYEVILSSVFSGIYTVLVLIAVYLLCRRGLKRLPIVVMLLIIVTLYTSTAIYWATLLRQGFGDLRIVATDLAHETSRIDTVMSSFRQTVLSNGTAKADLGALSPVQDQRRFFWPRPSQDCIGTASLTVNVVLGDAVVWWRALVLWRRSPAMRCVYSAILVCFTLVPGVIVTTHGFTSGAFYIRDEWGLAASILSLVSNAMATSLIAYKAWQHRKLVRMTFGSGSARTRVEKALAILIESGTIYCLLWLVIVVYQSCAIALSHGDSVTSQYIYRFHFIVEGSLVSLIGIYPTLVIILVAVNQSHCESTFTCESCSDVRFARGSGSHSHSRIAGEAANVSQCVIRLLPTRSTASIGSTRDRDARRASDASQAVLCPPPAEKKKGRCSEAGLGLA